MKTPSRSHPLDYLFVLRPVLMVPVWTVSLLGAASADEAPIDYGRADTLLLLVALSCLFGAVYLLNQVHDCESDRLNRKLHFLPLGLVSVRHARLGYVLLTALGLGLALRISGPHAALGLVIVVLGWLYSVSPWRLKDRPYAGLTANVLAHGCLVYLCGLRLHATLDTAAVVASGPYALAVGSVYLLTTIPDRDGDRQTGKTTLAVRLGPTRTAHWALGWYLAGVLVACYTVDVRFLAASLPVAPLYVRARDGTVPHALRAVGWAVALLSLLACTYAPWYLLVLGTGFIATRLYYRFRFDLTYP